MKLKALHIKFELDSSVEVTPIKWGKRGKGIHMSGNKKVAETAAKAVKDVLDGFVAPTGLGL